ELFQANIWSGRQLPRIRMMAEDGRPASAADSAYVTLRGDILSGDLPADERLTELGLAERLGLSRTPVREAIKRLLIEGFLTRATGEGLRVTALQPDEVEQIFRIRLMLESYGARRAAEFATETEIAELFRLAEEISARSPARSDADYDAMTEANAAFHRTIMQAARSPRLGSMLSLAVNLGLVLRTYRMYSPQDMTWQARPPRHRRGDRCARSRMGRGRDVPPRPRRRRHRRARGAKACDLPV
ncbi:GntR family transcriptional regulator, partial [Rhodosalinus sp.]|uniref:GntR family transcriptional regulator n=1 Tax=Rhodosalinus sp. TaxID=2047741 RepID=UPI00397C57C6